METVAYWQTLKGWGFVALTAVLIYYLTRRLSRSLQEALTQEQAAHAAHRKKGRELALLNQQLEARIKEGIERERQSEQLVIEQARLLALGETLRLIAHHWRQPLTQIGISIQEIEEAYRCGELSEAYLTQLSHETMKTIEKLSHTIDNFIDFFPASDPWQPFDLLAQAQEAIAIAHGVLEGDRITASLKSSGEALPVAGYRGAFNQMLTSVLNNAREAILAARGEGLLAPEAGEIQIYAYRQEEWCVLEVFNSGEPIAADKLPRLFDPYFSTKGPKAGTGISLYAAKIVIEQHMKGRLHAENRSGGVAFLLMLPAASG